jgi:hypothetical protein
MLTFFRVFSEMALVLEAGRFLKKGKKWFFYTIVCVFWRAFSTLLVQYLGVTEGIEPAA